jgi:hypothetical protein
VEGKELCVYLHSSKKAWIDGWGWSIIVVPEDCFWHFESERSSWVCGLLYGRRIMEGGLCEFLVYMHYCLLSNTTCDDL